MFAVVCLRTHRVERQRLEISDDHGYHGEPFLGATSSDEENEALHNFGTGRSSQVTTQLFYNCKKVNCLAFVPLGTHQGFAAVNAAELTHMPRHRIQ